MSATLSLDSAVVASKHHVSCELAGEAVILNLTDSIYYGLNEVGAVVWNLLQQRCTVRVIRDAILSEFEVEAAQCERDVVALLEKLTERGLVEVIDAAA